MSSFVSRRGRWCPVLAAAIAFTPVAAPVFADDAMAPAAAASSDKQTAVAAAETRAPIAIKPIEYTEETLDNGLHVIYVRMSNAPVVHVRVLYHVGSRDEKPDRQGFAHMFEHMMFRGSKNVPSEQHMKLINDCGGSSNAFTSFDQTTYVNTVPSTSLEMALWLEADRMASFKVNKDVFATERNVVAEEWRLRTANPPTGTMFPDFLKTAYTDHSYRWSTIGDMDQLRQSTVSELQEFWNKYYIPNNACLVISGDFDPARAKELAHKYFGWIPKGPAVTRDIKPEPKQTEARRMEVYRRSVPLADVLIGFKTAPYDSDDHVALDVLGRILGGSGGGGGPRGGMGGGRSSRLNQLLVNTEKPLCRSAEASNEQLQDTGLFTVEMQMLPGKNPDEAEQIVLAALREVVEKGVTQEELDRVRTQQRVRIIRGRETRTSLAGQVGEAYLFGGNAALANRDVDRLNALTPADVQAVAAKYLDQNAMTVVRYLPDPTGQKGKSVEDKSQGMKTATVADDGRVVEPRPVTFPADYPTNAPVAKEVVRVAFDKGTELNVNGVRVIVMRDDRLPLVNFQLVLRGGSDAEPKGKEGLGQMTAQMLRRGAGGMTYRQLNEDLESRGISLEVMDSGDTTRLSGSATVDQLDHAVNRAVQVIGQPSFPENEFRRSQMQTLAGLRGMLSQPAMIAQRELNPLLYGDSPAGRQSTFASLQSISLDDVKAWYEQVVRKDGAFVVISGDITPERAKALAEQLTANLKDGAPPVADYTLPPVPTGRRIILIDNADGKQANIRMAVRSYDLHSDEKYAGNVASRILSGGIESRLNRYVRAEKGLSYGVRGSFQAERHNGSFVASTDTNPDTVAESIIAMSKVLNDICAADVTPDELSASKGRIIGGMALETQSINMQAQRRVDALLNGYADDYYDVLPSKIEAVTAADVRKVVDKYIKDDQFTIVVVGPAAVVKPQLEQFGNVTVLPMPLQREGVPQMPNREMVRPGT